MKYVIVGLSSINALWMFIDGVFVIFNGKYIGPEKPGPWASLIGFTGLDVYKLGPMFVAFGIAWAFFVFCLLTGSTWTFWFGIMIGVLTLWYLPFGTIISMVVLVSLIFFRERVIET